MLFLRQLNERPAQPLKTVPHHMIPCLGEIFLPVGAQKRYRGTQPPERCDNERQDHRSLHADSKTSCSKHNTKTGNERNTASDISPGISVDETESILSGSVTSVSMAS